jgi:hypothetical protein
MLPEFVVKAQLQGLTTTRLSALGSSQPLPLWKTLLQRLPPKMNHPEQK